MVSFEQGLSILGAFLVVWIIVEILVRITGAKDIKIED